MVTVTSVTSDQSKLPDVVKSDCKKVATARDEIPDSPVRVAASIEAAAVLDALPPDWNSTSRALIDDALPESLRTNMRISSDDPKYDRSSALDSSRVDDAAASVIVREYWPSRESVA
jgi:hypothetical protein